MPEQNADIERLRADLVAEAAGLRVLIHASDPGLAKNVLAALYAINMDLGHICAQQARRDRTGRMLRSAEGQRAVILGTKPIGAAIARRLTSVGLQIAGISRSGHAHPDFTRVQPVDGLAAVAAAARRLVIAIPQAETMRELVSAHILAALFDGWTAAAARVFADNLGCLAHGEAPLNRVDPAWRH